MSENNWKKLDEHYAYRGWRSILVKRFELPNGEPASFDIVESPSFVTIIPITKAGRWVCIRQYRPGPEKFITGFPEGGVEEAESVKDTALRELKEETGYTAEQLIYLKARRNAYFTQTQYFVLALGCEKVKEQTLDDSEFIEVLELEQKKLLEMLRSPEDEFNNIAAAYLALDYQSK